MAWVTRQNTNDPEFGPKVNICGDRYRDFLDDSQLVWFDWLGFFGKPIWHSSPSFAMF